MKRTFKAENLSEKIRLDIFLAEKIDDITRSNIKNLALKDKVTVNGKAEKASKVLKDGDIIEIDLSTLNESYEDAPKNIPLKIIYEDEYLAVIDKPQGLTVHAGASTKGDTLVNALLYHFDDLSKAGGEGRQGVVHRLDKDTSGLLIIAKDDKTHLSLSEQLKLRAVKRIYIALLEGVVKDDSGTVKTFLSRHKTDRKKMAVANSGREAITDYKVIKRFENYTLCEFSLVTGRTHQIRVHSKHIGHAVVGDRTYGLKKQKFNLSGQLLHAHKLKFTHPAHKKDMEFTAPLPEYFVEVLKKLN